MKGKYKVRIQNSAVRFTFEIERNVNIIRGNSGTGKTTLIDMVVDYQAEGKASGVEVVCDKPCVAMSRLGQNWQNFLSGVSDSIVFIDEGERYVSSKAFAEFITKSDNYFVIATRNNLYNIPYSVDAVFEIKSSGKYGELRQTYNHFNKIYLNEINKNIRFTDNKSVITEDSKSGYEFFDAVSEIYGLDCRSCQGKSNIVSYLSEFGKSKALVVADGAAFGPEMANVCSIVDGSNISLFLPESFEWLILKSGLIKDNKLREIIKRPYDYTDSTEYSSWEQYFTMLLIELTKDTQYKYNKSNINPYYTSKKSVKSILGDYFEDL